MYYVDWFVDAEPSLHPWDKSYDCAVYDPFKVLLDLVLLIFCWNFASVNQGYWPPFLCFVVSLSGF